VLFIDRLARSVAPCAMLVLAACSVSRPPAGAPEPAPVAVIRPMPAPAAPALSHPERVHNWSELRLQAGRRLVEANPTLSYTGKVPQVLLAIPVLEIELNRDGSVRRIEVLRKPGQAPETLQLAIEAVHRAAPFGDVSRLPKPWKFAETFLFNDERKFKPRSLD
jgi:hypothetical protein